MIDGNFLIKEPTVDKKKIARNKNKIIISSYKPNETTKITIYNSDMWSQYAY